MTTSVNKQTEFELMKKYAKDRGGELLDPAYVNSHYKYTWKDAEGNIWKAPWYSMKQRGSWSKSSGYQKNAKSLIKYKIEDLQKKAEEYGGKCLSAEYINTKTKYLWEDSEGNQFLMKWDNVIAGQWSPKQAYRDLGKTKHKFTVEQIQEIAKSYGGEFLSTEYLGTGVMYLWKDKNGVIFEQSLDTILKHKEIVCLERKSRGQTQIMEYLNTLGVSYNKNDRKTLGNLKELDVFVPDSRIAIEYNGLFWHTEERLGKNYHLNKYKMCKNANIDLIQIFEHEWKDRNFQVKSFLKSKLNKNTYKIGARNCELKEVPTKEGRDFLEKYHILGKTNFKNAYGLYYENDLKILITVANHHRNYGNELVLTRCVSKDDWTVSGGLSRLCKHAFNIHGQISTWIDLRWSNGKSWINNGWKLSSILKPDYFYYNMNSKDTISKQSRRKSVVNTPEGMTELQHATLDGLKRVYDAGKLKLIYNG
jgi:hypothetical protein